MKSYTAKIIELPLSVDKEYVLFDVDGYLAANAMNSDKSKGIDMKKPFKLTFVDSDGDGFIDGDIVIGTYRVDEHQFFLEITGDLKAETSEEKEALDMIDTTSKQVEGLANNSELPNSSEWKNGDECVYKLHGAIVVGWHPSHPVLVIDSDAFGLVSCAINELSRPESPEQKAERERLEAAYDLYCNAQRAVDVIGYDSFGVFKSDKVQVKFWLSIVDKTDYHKAK